MATKELRGADFHLIRKEQTLSPQPNRSYKRIIVAGAIFFSLVSLSSVGLCGDGPTQLVGMKSEDPQTKKALPSNQRIIYGIVEEVKENSIKVDAGEAGGLTPRYLELEKLDNQASEVKQGDRLKIIVNNQNRVVDYQLANTTH